NTQVEDSITVYLRRSSAPFYMLDYAKNFVNYAGQSVMTFDQRPFSYYIDIKHRNMVETWSNVVSYGPDVTYNMTTGISQAYGSNLILVDSTPVTYACYNG